MNINDNLKQDSIYIYGKIYELLDHLNNHNFKCYINNEKNVDLSKEFKFQKKRRVQFISILDYYARFKNKESEFLILPIIFNKDYEILYIGVSMFFKENFSEEYKQNFYNYIELFIHNIDKNDVNFYENKDSETNRNSISKLLINLEDLKTLHKEERLKINRNRIMNNCSNNHAVYLKNNNYYFDDKKNHHIFAEENYHLKEEDNYILYSSNINYNDNKNFKLKKDDHLVIYNTCNSLRSNSNIEDPFLDYNYKIHSNNDINNTNNNRNSRDTSEINNSGKNNNNIRSSSTTTTNDNNKNNNNNDNSYTYSNDFGINRNADVINSSIINSSSSYDNNTNNSNNFKNNINYNNNDKKNIINFKCNSNINISNNNNNDGNKDNRNNEYMNDEVNTNNVCGNNPINNMCYYKNMERRNENKRNYIEERSFENRNMNYQLSYYKETENFVLNIKKSDETSIKIENSLRNNSEEKLCTSFKGIKSIKQNNLNAKVVHNTDMDKLNEGMSYIEYEMAYNQSEYIKTNDIHLNKYSEGVKDISSNNIIYRNYMQENNNNNEKWHNFKSGYHSFNGNRTYNEDRVITIENINDFINKEYNEIRKKKELNESFDKEYSDIIHRIQNVETYPFMYCAIYDGHNGENAVNLVQKFLHVNVYSYIVNGNGISNSLKYAFQSIDEYICKQTLNNEEDNHSNLSSGSTACVSVIFKNILYIANIGDSRCVLSKNGRAIVLTVDHRASVNKKEEERILKSGGVLDDEGYLGGCLGVCRGFGSFDKKTKEKLKGLICEPDLFQIKLTDDDEFLIICCDGVFDVMTSQEAVNTVRASLVQSTDANIASEALCRLAYKRKSLDNLSVVVVIFQNPEMKKKTSINENSSLYSSQTGRVRRKIKFSALKDLINP